jgi:hypothetical protein
VAPTIGIRLKQHICLRGEVDVIPGYRISIPFNAQKAGVKIKNMLPSSYGIEFYGDSLFTTAGLVHLLSTKVKKVPKKFRLPRSI